MEQNIVYVAGNPNAYPIEYYDLDTQSYQGVIPELLRRFSRQSAYDVRYYSPGRKDQRASLAGNRQVDIVSCPEELGIALPREGEDILLLEDGGNGQAVTLCLLDVAPKGLDQDLRSFLSGVSREELIGMVVQAARSDPPQSRRLIQGVFFGLVLAVALLATVLAGVIVSGRRRRRRLQNSGELDPVTGLGNRTWLGRCCKTTLNDRNRVLYTMFCFSVSPAAAAGGDPDAISRHMAAVLQGCASGTDLVARISDACFAVLRLSAGKYAATEWMTSVLGRLREEVCQAGGDGRGITAGACPLKAGDRELDEIISRAVQGAQMARKTERGCLFFGEEAERELQERQRLRDDVRHALQNREFQIYVQFYVDTFTGWAVGGEVIPLWEHPERGLLPAEQWRALLEQEGLSVQLDGYMLERACAMLESLREKGKTNVFLLCRLSEDSLRSENLGECLEEIFSGYEFERQMLYLGVPQRVLERELQEISKNIKMIQGLGMRLVLDSFNGQLTVLAQAGEARFCGVKLKENTPGWKQSRLVLRAAVRAGHEMGLAVLAEGADTEELADYLRELGCDMLRGELYAQPLPAWEAMKKLLGKSGERERLSL